MKKQKIKGAYKKNFCKINLLLGIALFLLMITFSFSALGENNQIYFQADNYLWTSNPPLLKAWGKVKIRYGGIYLETEEVSVNLESFECATTGKADLIRGEQFLGGENLLYNFKEDKGKLSFIKGSSLLDQSGNTLFFKAKEARISKDIIKLYQATITTCDLHLPHYRIEAREVEIYLEEEIIVKNATFYIGDIPLFWVPFFKRFFRKENRPFVPQFGYEDFSGWFVKGNYYFPLPPNYGGILHLDYREKKGSGYGLDFSYTAKKDKGSIETYFVEEKDSLKKRWSVRLNYKKDFFNSSSLQINLNKVSDENFLKDYFNEELKNSSLVLEHRGSGYKGYLLFEPRVNSFRKGFVERVPQIKFILLPQKIGKSNIYINNQAEITRFKEEEKGEFIRADSFVDASSSFSLNPFNITPRVGYHLFWYRGKEGEQGYRRIPYQTLDLSSRLQSQYGNYTHLINPKITYYHSDETNDNLDFLFDIGDYKKETTKIHPPNLAKLSLEDSFYHYKNKVALSEVNIGYDLTKKKENFTPLNFTFSLTPVSSLLKYFRLNLLYELYGKEYSIINSDLRLKEKEWYVDLGLRKNLGENVNDFVFQGGTELGKKWKLSTFIRYNLEKKETSEEKYSLWRDLHCWAAQFSIETKPEKEYWIIFHIKAFPQYWIKFSPESFPWIEIGE